MASDTIRTKYKYNKHTNTKYKIHSYKPQIHIKIQHPKLQYCNSRFVLITPIHFRRWSTIQYYVRLSVMSIILFWNKSDLQNQLVFLLSDRKLPRLIIFVFFHFIAYGRTRYQGYSSNKIRTTLSISN